MTKPQQIGASGWSGRKSPADTPFISASTVASKVLAKPALERWAEQATAEAVVREIGWLAKLCVDNPEAAVERIKGLKWEQTSEDGPLKATERGTEIHEVIEGWLVDPTVPRKQLHPAADAQISPYLNHVALWFQENRPEMIAVEEVVFNEYAMIAGRFDMAVRFHAGPHADGKVYLLDTKTKSKSTTGRGFDVKPYSDQVGPQLAAYRWAGLRATFPPRMAQRGDRAYFLNAAEREACVPLSDLLGPAEEIETAVLLVTPHWARMFPIDTGLPVLDWAKSIADAQRGKSLKLVGEKTWDSIASATGEAA